MTDQYIITEEELEEWEAGGMCWNEEQDLHRSIRSHPYNPQAERERVLDELAKWVREYDTMYYGDDMPIDILRDKFEELRSKQEQP